MQSLDADSRNMQAQLLPVGIADPQMNVLGVRFILSPSVESCVGNLQKSSMEKRYPRICASGASSLM